MRSAASIPLTPSHCHLLRQGCQARAHWRYVVFYEESRFCFGASDDRVLVRKRPGGPCNQTIGDLGSVYLHLES
ncbi:hypothetical protein TNCV_598691 [Trichonephila clavipes]|nr:hypothetical protein TNCV_598691 [Trichonephila clavipes]